MKSRIQSYGKFTIILISCLFLVTLGVTSTVGKETAAAAWGGFAGLLTAIGSILGLTIVRYGARETALSIKGGYRPEMMTKHVHNHYTQETDNRRPDLTAREAIEK